MSWENVLLYFFRNLKRNSGLRGLRRNVHLYSSSLLFISFLRFSVAFFLSCSSHLWSVVLTVGRVLSRLGSAVVIEVLTVTRLAGPDRALLTETE